MMKSSRTIHSTEILLREEEEKRSSATRYQDLCLVFRRKKTGEILLAVGGRWDHLEKCYLPGGPARAKQARTIDLQESQVEFTLWFKDWLEAFLNGDPRDTRLVLTAGERRGGKTTIGLLCTIAAAIAHPRAITWAVSSTFGERDELEQAILRFVPTSFYTYRGAPRYRFIFPNGSVLRNLSADDPETLKQGQVDVCFSNEAQKMTSGVLVNTLPGIIDRGGLVILAANPPRRIIGEWVRDLKIAIESKQLPSAKFFGFSAKLNEAIDQKAREDVGAILRVVDEAAAKADDEGLWLPVGEVAYQNYDPAKHEKSFPDIGDITRDVLKKKIGRPRDYIVGVDFQINPHNASVLLKIFRGLNGESIYWAVREILVPGTEDEFLDEVDSLGILQPESTLWVGDASGTWQNAAHTKGRNSYEIFRGRRWEVVAPQRAKTEDRRPSNPPIENRLNAVNNLLSQGRLFVDPRGCPRLAKGLKKCALKLDKPFGVHAHITDALGYALYYLEPKPTQQNGGPLKAWSINIKRGSDF